MPIIILETKIKTNIDLCFDLARSIDLHRISTAKTKEKAIGGVTSGLINLNETVTWEAVHFGIKQQLTAKITQLERPFHFRDEQVKGAFKYFCHDHYFQKYEEQVMMTDHFEFASPFGPLGKAVDKLILFNYMKRFLMERNAMLKEYAETDKWKSVLE